MVTNGHYICNAELSFLQFVKLEIERKLEIYVTAVIQKEQLDSF